MQSYALASARIVLDATGVNFDGFSSGRVVLNVTDNVVRGLTVQDPKTGKALKRVKGIDVRRVGLLNPTPRDRATFQAFTR